jgi:hypothetical protein
MATADGFDALAQACIANHEEIMRFGSPEMQAASRLLLFALAEEIRRRGEGWSASEVTDISPPTQPRRTR